MQPIDCGLSPHTRACSFTANQLHASTGLPFNGLHPRNLCNYMDYDHLLTQKGWKAELAWLVDP